MKRMAAHEALPQAEKIEGSSDRTFGIVFAVVFAIIGLWPLLGEPAPPRWWSLGVGAVFLILAFVLPRVLAPLNRLWLRFGLLLHRIVNPIVLGAMFYVVITPVGLLRRLISRDPLSLRRDSARSSYWVVREEPGPSPASMKQQF